MNELAEETDDWTIDGVLSYLDARVRQIFDATNARRPRWTVQDAQAVAFLRGAHLEHRERRAA